MSQDKACAKEINLETIRTRLSRKDIARPVVSPDHHRAAAVLIPLVCHQEKWHLLFTRRTDQVQKHKGQVSFPGGAVEDGDENREQTALREAHEEIGVREGEIQILGRLHDMLTVTGYVITPVVAHMNWPINLTLSKEEVSRAFIVPIAWLADRGNYSEKPMMLSDGRHENVVQFSPFDGEIIWGATARLTLNFIQTIFI